MKPKSSSSQRQSSFLYQYLLDQLNPKVPLLLLAKKIPWEKFEREFSSLYGDSGRPAKPVRLMVGLLLLTQLENMSDERVAEAWVQNPYYQAFCGMEHFQWQFPCNSSELVHFRKRIGEEGVERIFQASVLLHGEQALEREVVIDTTVQEKNITFPTDTKLRVKVIGRCWKLAAEEGIQLRHCYRRGSKRVLRIRFSRSMRDKKEGGGGHTPGKNHAQRLVAGRPRKLPESAHAARQEELARYRKAINQERRDTQKIYSLHEPEVCCISKGKEHKKYEFGSKATIVMTKTRGIIVGAKNFPHNEYDGNTFAKVLSQVTDIRGSTPETAFCDRGFRGQKRVGETAVALPESPSSKVSGHFKRKARKNFGWRSVIEPVIGHLKNDFRLAHNYLKGTIGDAVNLLLAAAAFNCKKWMNAVAERLSIALFALCVATAWEKDS